MVSKAFVAHVSRYSSLTQGALQPLLVRLLKQPSSAFLLTGSGRLAGQMASCRHTGCHAQNNEHDMKLAGLLSSPLVN